jgi:hypothetical protein
MRSLKSANMNVLQSMGGSSHFGNRCHYRVGGLRRPIGIFSRLHVIESCEGGHAPRAATLFGPGAEFRAGRVDWLVHGLTLSYCGVAGSQINIRSALYRSSGRAGRTRLWPSWVVPLRVCLAIAAPLGLAFRIGHPQNRRTEVASQLNVAGGELNAYPQTQFRVEDMRIAGLGLSNLTLSVAIMRSPSSSTTFEYEGTLVTTLQVERVNRFEYLTLVAISPWSPSSHRKVTRDQK